jgi:hypothetical protein
VAAPPRLTSGGPGRAGATARSQAIAGPPRWLLDYDIWGRVVRFTDVECSITTANGGTLRYAPGLESPDYTEARNEYGLRIESPLVDWAKLRAQGTPLERCPVTLRRWFEGQTFEEAEVVLIGTAQGVTYGAVGEPLEMTISRLDEDREDTIPRPSSVIDARTWPVTSPFELPENVVGAYVPFIIGEPGGAGVPAAPALMVEYSESALYRFSSKLVICFGECAATEVLVYDLSADMASDTRTVSTTTDLLGNLVSYVTFSTLLRPYADHEYAVAWANTGGGIKQHANDTTSIRGLGHVLLWALRQQTRIPVDAGSMEAQCAFLDVFKIDSFINSPIDPIRWIEESLEPLFPIRKRFGSAGMYYEAIRLGQAAPDATAVLNVDSGAVSRDGGMVTRWPDAGLANRITLRYRDSFNLGHVGYRVIDAALDESDPYVLPSAYCQISQATYGLREVTETTSVVREDETAALVLQWLARSRTLPRESIAYTGSQELMRFAQYETVLLTDSEMYLSARPAVVIDRQITNSGVRLLLELEPDPMVLERRVT